MAHKTELPRFPESSIIRCKAILQTKDRIISPEDQFFVFGYNGLIDSYCLVTADNNLPGHFIFSKKQTVDYFEHRLEDNQKGMKG